MKLRTLLLCTLLACTAHALDVVVGTTVFHGCEQFRVVGAELQFRHDTGTAHVRYDRLPAPLAQKYFTPQQLDALRQQDANAAEAARFVAEQREADARREAQRRKAEMDRKAAAAAVEQAAADARKRAEEEKAAAKAKRLAPFRAGEWQRMLVKAVGPAKNGHIIRTPDGKFGHLSGGPPMLDGDERAIYLQAVGTYEYTTALGGASRVIDYEYRGNAWPDVEEELAIARKDEDEVWRRSYAKQHIGAFGADLLRRLNELKEQGMIARIPKLPDW
jgi:hypothetical protein